jgi:4-amino-4-deoxychorismate lyase
MQCLKNAQALTAVSILDRGFHYGDGCFTTARIRDGKIELAALHWARLELACQRLSLVANLEFIEQSLTMLQSEYEALNGTLKIVISRGEGQRGYSLPEHPADVWVYYYPQTLTDFHYDSIKTGVAQQAIGLSMPQLVGLKSLNRLEQVMLKKEIDQCGWSEALVADVQGDIVEGVSSNCFIRINNRWITPELRYNGVHGVMRAEILARMQAQGIECDQACVPVTEISQIQSLFFCNALHPMRIVTQLDAQNLDPQPCIDLFHSLQLHQMH